MLSIHKLSIGQERYYLEQGLDRVDVVESVGDGIEEYYVGGSEERGDWLGVGARKLGLSGIVRGDELRHVLAGQDVDGTVLRASRVPVTVAGYDLTFSAPKSVSVVFALGDGVTRSSVRAAHDRATREALLYLERTAAAVRRGAGGARVEPATGFIAAGFRHRTSRLGDPQLHSHVLVANLSQGSDGRWSTLDGRRIYAHARTASFVYQAVLRSELERRLGVRWLSVRDGIAEIAGIPKPVIRAYSRRRVEIEAELERHGTSGPRASEAAALTTRKPKNRCSTFEALTRGWRARAAELGFGREQLERVLHVRDRVRGLDARGVERIFDRLAAPIGLTQRRATFSRRDVVAALCSRLPGSESASAADIEDFADRFLASPRVVPLVPADADPETRLAFRRRDGRVLPVVREEWIYSTPELLALEQRLIELAIAGRDAKAGQADQVAVHRAMAARPTLGADQRAMVEQLCLRGERVSVVVGKAGTGKTFALAAARDAWHQSNRPVLGIAVARRAANQLQADAGIASTSVAALVADLERATGGLPRGAVLVVDEAGMIGTRQLAKLFGAVEHADGKLVLVGDHRQLPELEAGGTFRGLVRRGLAVELTENRRQRETWERQALDDLRDGRPDRALQAYVEHKRLHVLDTPAEARGQLVTAWSAAHRNGDAVMIAQRRSDVTDLNERARVLLRRSGRLGETELRTAGAGFAVGDDVVIRRNDHRLGVTNGERGRVVAVDHEHQALTIRVRSDTVLLDRDFLATSTLNGDPPLAHGYAITCHTAQGLTVDHTFVLAEQGLTAELGYTALSRGRSSNHVYLAERIDQPRAEYAPTATTERTAVERLGDALRTSRAAVLAIDAGWPDLEQQLADARAELAVAGRARIDSEGPSWRRGRRERIGAARSREAAAAKRVAELNRTIAEQQHSARSLADAGGSGRTVADEYDRVVERQLERSRGRGLER